MKRYSLFLISLILLMTTGCNQRKEVAENPFFEEWETPYGVPPFDRIRPEHFLPAFQRAMSIQEAEIDAIKSNGDQPSFENVILAYDRSGLMLEQVGLVFNMLCSADVNDQLLAAKEQAMPLLAAHRDNILLDEVLFDKIKAVYDRRGSLGLDAVQTRLVEKIYGKFVRAGALLDPQQKERLRQINGELALLPVKFGNNVLRATNDFVLKLTDKQLDGLPASVQGIAREKAAELGMNDAWVVTLDASSRIPFLTYSARRDLREQLYKAISTAATHIITSLNFPPPNDFHVHIRFVQLLPQIASSRIREKRNPAGSVERNDPRIVHPQLRSLLPGYALHACRKSVKLFISQFQHEIIRRPKNIIAEFHGQQRQFAVNLAQPLLLLRIEQRSGPHEFTVNLLHQARLHGIETQAAATVVNGFDLVEKHLVEQNIVPMGGQQRHRLLFRSQ